jgi:hypothetical protein
MSPTIGILKESSLHASLKQWYAQPGDQVEMQVDGYWVDIMRPATESTPELLLEIQTGNFSAMKRKLTRLLENHAVRVIYPIAVEKYILRVAVKDDAKPLSRRKSPKRGREHELFAEMMRIPRLACLPNFSLEVCFIREEEIWQADGRGSWRRKGVSIIDRRLVDVLRSTMFVNPHDYLRLLPSTLVQPFTVRQLASEIGGPRWLASRMAYTLREMGLMDAVGKKGNAILYALRENTPGLP